ncbi:Crp/Fnr family transcriptional regulator [Lacrimispora sp. 210928-DFI.3.58]|uniref:Crp/Fnr family transcriptional regulator n=1 Tax=Lacrimispora sp. 210928-DFI.3.58 TaxID=2883214 RepID=UPI001D069087|nr:Crp/Fnr family transcriptional regulator [Lacrimispora sp. 210928-DFI.3.58]MCB7317740.1 Crp/Fnr family transcriptional regulator [Lacrimispora sp. 210928-DFI.3.58]
MQGKNRLYEQKFFQNVARDTADKLWAAGSIREFPAGHVLMRAKDCTSQVYIQLSGKSMVYNLTHMGKRKIIFLFGGGVLLNEHVMNAHPASLFCETIEKSRIFSVPLKLFLQCMEEDFTLTRAVLETQECRIWRLGHQLKNTQGGIYMERKLAAKLWKLSRDFGIQKPDGIEIDINLSVTMLADMLGSSRETTSRLCSILIDLGLMKINKKRITIINPEKMSVFYKTGETE